MYPCMPENQGVGGTFTAVIPAKLQKQPQCGTERAVIESFIILGLKALTMKKE